MDEDLANIDGYNVSLRKTRQGSECSMSSQRLDEIVGALMKPIKDLKQNFDMDINSLLEEYLTEAGIRQLDEGRCPIEDSLPNFAEVALLLQQSANIYSKKVDYLWIKVVEIVQSFGSNATGDVNDPDEPEETVGEGKKGKKTKRKEVEILNFECIDLKEANNIDLKENSDPKPLGVLPKNFIEFEPRIITENDIQIKDFKGDVIGVSTDFRCNWNTDHNGMLCDDLEFSSEKEPLDMCTMDVTANTISSPPDSGHCSDYCTSTTPVNSDSDYMCNETFTSPHSERDYPDLSSLLETTVADTTIAEETTMVNDSIVDSTLQTTVLETTLESVKCKKRKATDGTLPLTKKSSKYDMQHRIAGTSHLIKLKPCCFELPKSMIMKVVERRKNKLKKLRMKMGKYDVNERSFDTQYFLDTFVASCNKNRSTGWHRKQMLKELKVLATEWEKDFLGFTDYDNTEDVNGFIGFEPSRTEQLQRIYSRKKILYSAAIAEAREEPREDQLEGGDIAEDDDHHYEPLGGIGTEEEGGRGGQDTDDVLDAVTQRLNAEATLDKTNLKCSKEQLEISQRVEEWHTSIRADLAKAERRKMFDLWAYSSRVLTSFSRHKDASNRISFHHMMRDKPKEDTARYFLATLMLANSQNIDIVQPDSLEYKDFDMRLLSMERRMTDEDFACL